MLVSGRRLDHVRMVLLAIEDITERLGAENQQKVLSAELSHRVKNALTVVRALASQTAAHCKSIEDFQKVFEGRLSAFAKAHSQLIERAWEGGELKVIIDDALSLHAVETRQFEVIEGPRVVLKPKAALALNMVLHELATNAIKYGALSIAAGRVRISWTVRGGGDHKVHLFWKESGGPPVEAPKRKGFGSKLIEQSMAFDLAGKAHLQFDSSGLQCELVFDNR